MRFRLHHLLACVTVFAVFLAFAKATGHAGRDGVWEVVVVEKEERVFTNLDGEGPPLYDYFGHLKDGDREIRIRLGSSWLTEFEALPRPGDSVEFKEPAIDRAGLSTNRSFIVSQRSPILPRLLTVLVIAGFSAVLVMVSVVSQNLIVRFVLEKRRMCSVRNESSDAAERGRKAF